MVELDVHPREGDHPVVLPELADVGELVDLVRARPALPWRRRLRFGFDCKCPPRVLDSHEAHAHIAYDPHRPRSSLEICDYGLVLER